MTERAAHKFQFTAQQIADAAKDEAEYHEQRVEHWQKRAEKALQIVKERVSPRVTETAVTGGNRASVVVDYGEPDAWREYQLAYEKIQIHRDAADRYRTDQKLYYTQGARVYELDSDDVHHFRLGGQERES